jgi:hyperosmotically inducible protein
MRLMLIGVLGTAILGLGCAQTDPGITASVKSRLAADDVVRASAIDVDTTDHVVTLKGQVRTTQEEARALQLARDTKGVVNVVDQLEVVPEAAPTTGVAPGETGYETAPAVPTDASITATVKANLLADPDTSGLRIDVDTDKRVVTLSGTVKSEAEKTEAVQIARGVNGVTSVNDRLTIERPK